MTSTPHISFLLWKWNHTVSGPLHLAAFMQHNVFSHPCSSLPRSAELCPIMRVRGLYPSISWHTFGFTPRLTITNAAAMNVCARLYTGICSPFFWINTQQWDRWVTGEMHGQPYKLLPNRVPLDTASSADVLPL